MSKMNPKDYSKKLSGTQLLSIFLIQSDSEIDRLIEPSAIEVRINDKSDFKNMKDGLTEVYHHYTIQVTSKKKAFFKVNIKLCIELRSKELFDKEFFDVFSKVTLPTITFQKEIRSESVV